MFPCSYSTLWEYSVQTGIALELDNFALLEDFALELDGLTLLELVFAELEEGVLLDEESVFELDDFALLEDCALLELEVAFVELEDFALLELDATFFELDELALLELDVTFWEEDVDPSYSSGPAPVLLSPQAENVSPNRADMVMAVTIFFICMRAPLGLISIHNIY